MTINPEFSRVIDIRQINDEPLVLEPTEAERRRLAARFQLSGVNAMQATISLRREGDKVEAKGHLEAAIVQACAISGEDFPVAISEPISLRFVPPGEAHDPDEEIEITADECDEIEYEGTSFDLGEAVAQSLALAIDPFAEGPDAERARAEHKLGGDVASGPFAALAALKKD
jgi:uncharacterized metal-binding protein YceD (DUF177 family)